MVPRSEIVAFRRCGVDDSDKKMIINTRDFGGGAEGFTFTQDLCSALLGTMTPGMVMGR